MDHDSETLLSVIIPILDEEESLEELHRRLIGVVEQMGRRFELIYVDDGSRDRSFEVLKGIHERDSRVTVLQFRKNFGKSAALSAGFQEARGDVVVTIDADLQDIPEEIPRLVSKLEEGYDLVSSWRERRKDPFLKRVISRIYNWAVSTLSGVKIRDFNSGLKCYQSELLREINVSAGMHRYLPLLAAWRGFSISQIKVAHDPRLHGRSKYGIGRLFRGFFDFLAVMMLTKYSQRPFHVFGYLGMLLTIIGLGINVYVTVGWFLGRWIENRPIILLGVLLIIVGFQVIFFGLLSEIVMYSSNRDISFSVKQKLGHDADRK